MEVDAPITHELPQEATNAVGDTDPYLFLKSDRKMVKVYLKDITYIESLKDYVRIKTVDGREVISLQKISYLEKKLPTNCFLRIHKSYIIAKHHINAFSASTIEMNDKVIPIGRSYKSEVMKALDEDHSII